MTHRRCETCYFWDRGGSPIASACRKVDPVDYLGVCRHDPPLVIQTVTKPLAYQAETHAEAWCGMWLEAPDEGDPDDGERADGLIVSEVVQFPVAA